MKFVTLCYAAATAIALATMSLAQPLASQPPPTAVSVNAGLVSASALDAFAAAHVEVAALRGKAQAELAEPRSKKAEVQISVRAKLQDGTLRALKAHNLTEAEFARLTRLVSTDDALRKQFDEAVARLSAGRGS